MRRNNCWLAVLAVSTVLPILRHGLARERFAIDRENTEVLGNRSKAAYGTDETDFDHSAEFVVKTSRRNEQPPSKQCSTATPQTGCVSIDDAELAEESKHENRNAITKEVPGDPRSPPWISRGATEDSSRQITRPNQRTPSKLKQRTGDLESRDNDPRNGSTVNDAEPSGLGTRSAYNFMNGAQHRVSKTGSGVSNDTENRVKSESSTSLEERRLEDPEGASAEQRSTANNDVPDDNNGPSATLASSRVPDFIRQPATVDRKGNFEGYRVEKNEDASSSRETSNFGEKSNVHDRSISKNSTTIVADERSGVDDRTTYRSISLAETGSTTAENYEERGTLVANEELNGSPTNEPVIVFEDVVPSVGIVDNEATTNEVNPYGTTGVTARPRKNATSESSKRRRDSSTRSTLVTSGRASTEIDSSRRAYEDGVPESIERLEDRSTVIGGTVTNPAASSGLFGVTFRPTEYSRMDNAASIVSNMDVDRFTGTDATVGNVVVDSAANASSVGGDNATHKLEDPWPVKQSAVVEGDLVLGGLMMVHEREDHGTCGPVMPQGGIQALEAMLYTLDWLNDRNIVPGVKIGAHILDDCDKDTYGLEMAVDFIKGKRIRFFYHN